MAISRPEATPPGEGSSPLRPAEVLTAPNRWRGWAHRWLPVVALMFLAALLPELLTGSTPVPVLIPNPPGLLFLLALYGCGALLIREASVRWRRGWAAVLPLGGAYGLVEEGLFAKTLIDPAQPMVGYLGIYGRWLGLNWILVAALVLFHALFSIAVQILLIDLIFPWTRGRPFLGILGTTLALGAYAFIAILGFFVNDPTHYFPEPPVLLGLLTTIGLLILIAHRIPPRFLLPWKEAPDRRPRWFEAEGLLFMAGFFALLALGTAFIPVPAVVVALYLGLAAATAWFLLAHAGLRGNELQKLAFVEGMILFFLPFDAILEVSGNRGVVVVPVAVLALLRWLRRRDGQAHAE